MIGQIASVLKTAPIIPVYLCCKSVLLKASVMYLSCSSYNYIIIIIYKYSEIVLHVIESVDRGGILTQAMRPHGRPSAHYRTARFRPDYVLTTVLQTSSNVFTNCFNCGTPGGFWALSLSFSMLRCGRQLRCGRRPCWLWVTHFRIFYVMMVLIKVRHLDSCYRVFWVSKSVLQSIQSPQECQWIQECQWRVYCVTGATVWLEQCLCEFVYVGGSVLVYYSLVHVQWRRRW